MVNILKILKIIQMNDLQIFLQKNIGLYTFQNILTL